MAGEINYLLPVPVAVAVRIIIKDWIRGGGRGLGLGAGAGEVSGGEYSSERSDRWMGRQVF